jgi:tetratricopeptide (TPR) repeat protein
MKLKPILLILAFFFLLFVFKIYGAINAPDKQCHRINKVVIDPAKELKTAEDFFGWGDNNYDIGNCQDAVYYYTKAIELDPNFAQAYNNRAYTNMRMQNYKDALPDLDKAIEIKPDYVTALMNRGDIYNYYYAIDRKKAIADYDKVISLGTKNDRSGRVCGHKALAENNNMLPLVSLKMLINNLTSSKDRCF